MSQQVPPTSFGPSSTLPPTLQGLLRVEAYPHPVDTIQVVETHMSWILLTGRFAYKIKRPVHFTFADFRDPVRRAALCAEELRLNRRFAPELYLSTQPIWIRNGLASLIDGDRQIETAVQMRQFDRSAELDVLVEQDAITADELADFGGTLAQIHRELPCRAADAAGEEGAEAARGIRRNYVECLSYASPGKASAALHELRHALGRALRRDRPTVARRAAEGRIRECHGDLHLSNLVRIEGSVTPFDALEFEPAFRWIDVADEVAFLCADLQGYGRPDLAYAFLGGYLESSGDYGLLQTLDLHLAHRGLVRAKVMAIRAAEAEAASYKEKWLERFGDYLAVSRDALAPRSPLLLLMHGFSGSGKTWIARQLARELPAIHLRSDLERKRLAGLSELERSGSRPGSGLYSGSHNAQTYDRLVQCARAGLSGRKTVICDAAFLTRRARAAFRTLADQFGIPALMLDCRAPATELRRRVEHRQATGLDASEANAAALEWQLQHSEPLSVDEGITVMEIDTTAAPPLAVILKRLAEARGTGLEPP